MWSSSLEGSYLGLSIIVSLNSRLESDDEEAEEGSGVTPGRESSGGTSGEGRTPSSQDSRKAITSWYGHRASPAVPVPCALCQIPHCH